jgi:hypothetical protein
MALQHRDILNLLVRATEQIHGIAFNGILVPQAGCKNRKSAFDTLDAYAALFACHRQLPNLCTADRIADQVRASVAAEEFNDF